jgi:hypothetical protein
MRDFFMGESSPGMIDWTAMPTYNTIMSMAAGAGLVALVMFARDLLRHRPAGVDGDDGAEQISTDGWALTFGSLGVILALTGLHMSLTWPLASGGFAFDNIIFGETSLGFGVLMTALAMYLWRRGDQIRAAESPVREVARAARPLSIFIIGLGLALIAIMFAGIVYQFFAAPPQEPISGWVGQWPWLEAWALSLVFGVIGAGAVLMPVAVRGFLSTPADRGSGVAVPPVAKVVAWIFSVTGLIFVLFGAFNFYSHIGLVVNTQ